MGHIVPFGQVGVQQGRFAAGPLWSDVFHTALLAGSSSTDIVTIIGLWSGRPECSKLVRQRPIQLHWV